MARRLPPLNALRAFEAAIGTRPRRPIAAFRQWLLAETEPLRSAA
jgi:hypothetical protein